VQYLCCELSELQSSKALKGLRVYDIAHVAWRMRVGTELEAAIEKFEKVGVEYLLVAVLTHGLCLGKQPVA
jgi:hypothetical protein